VRHLCSKTYFEHSAELAHPCTQVKVSSGLLLLKISMMLQLVEKVTDRIPLIIRRAPKVLHGDNIIINKETNSGVA